MSASASSDTQDDYDKLGPEEREIRDNADRQREAEEQAGTGIIFTATFIHLNYLEPSLIHGNKLWRRLTS